jgi:hypothetical protein
MLFLLLLLQLLISGITCNAILSLKVTTTCLEYRLQAIVGSKQHTINYPTMGLIRVSRLGKYNYAEQACSLLDLSIIAPFRSQD